MKRKGILIGVLVVLAICFVFKLSTKQEEKGSKETIFEKTTNESELQDEQIDEQLEDIEEVAEDETKGLTDEVTGILEVEREEIWSVANEWAVTNGRSSISEIEFSHVMSIDFSEEKYSIECRLIFGDKGNGVVKDENEEMIMDYYKSRNEFQFHE